MAKSYLDRWVRAKELRRCTESTCRRYSRIIQQALDFQRRQGQPTNPRFWREGDFDHLREKVARSRWAFGILLDFARFSGNARVREVPLPTQQRSARVRWLDKSAMGTIVQRSKRDPLLALVVVLGLGQGMRRVEWRRLCVEDVDLPGRRMLVRGKGRGSPKLIWVPLHPSFPQIWLRYLRARRQLVSRAQARGHATPLPSQALVHIRGGQLTPYSDSGLDRIVRRLGRQASVGRAEIRLSSHMLRRSGATLLEEVLLKSPHPTLDGVYRAVQAFLRHDDLTTTMGYLQGNPARQRRAMMDYGRALPWTGATPEL